MDHYTAAEIATAFMQQNDKTSWEARSLSRETGDVVIFKSTTGMISLMYTPHDDRFIVKFNKFQGAWGDYIGAIARSMFTVLHTLKSAGLAFDAPPSIDGMVIEATTSEDSDVRVRWPGQSPELSAVDDVETLEQFSLGGEPLPPVL